MSEYLKLIVLILLVYLAVYSIINRICDYIEHLAYAKHGTTKCETSDGRDNQNEKTRR